MAESAIFLCSVLLEQLVSRQTYQESTSGAIHSTKISGNFGPKLNGSVRSNRKSFEKTCPPFEVDHFSRSDRLEFWLNGSRPSFPIECFHVTSWRPYWCPKTIKRRPCWCSKPVLWELNSFLMQTLSFVPINLHRCSSRE